MLSAKAAYIIDTIRAHGGEAYAVGGCVRDLLLGRAVHDWDICTSLRPEEVLQCFPHTVPTGLRHGTVTVLLDGEGFEVTTFRAESAYADHRRPDSVSFSASLAEDLARRDFTVNAMAMRRDGEIIDLFHGKDDLRRGVIRCVGDPERRFTEDALRILRAVRFSAQLSFRIDPETEAAMRQCEPFCAYLSAERIRDEVEKILLSPQPERLGALSGILARFGWRETAELSALRALRSDRALRWAGLVRLEPTLSLSGLRLDTKTIRLCTGAAQCGPLGDRVCVKRAVFRLGREAAACAAELQGKEALFSEVLSSGECILLSELAVNGRDFPDCGGKRLGALLQALLAHVWAHPEDNTKEILVQITQTLSE